MAHDFNLTANGGQRIEAIGRFVHYKSGTGAIRVTTSKGEIIDLVPGQGVRGLEFSGITVKDISGATNTGLLIIGNFEFFDNNLYGTMTVNGAVSVTGKVSTVDASRDVSFAGATFMATQVSTAVTPASNQNMAILKNPAASGKNLIVERVFVAGGQQGVLRHMLMSGALPATTGQLSGPYNTGVNVKVGGGASVARTYTDVIANADVTTYAAAQKLLVTSHIANGGSATWASSLVTFPKPVILVPDSQMILWVDNLGGLNYSFEYREE